MNTRNGTNLTKRKLASTASLRRSSTKVYNTRSAKKQKQLHAKNTSIVDDASTHLTDGAVETMLQGLPFSGSLVVGLSYESYVPTSPRSRGGSTLQWTIFDSRQSVRAIIPADLLTRPLRNIGNRVVLIRVRGYVTSTANTPSLKLLSLIDEISKDNVGDDEDSPDAEPFLYITAFDYLPTTAVLGPNNSPSLKWNGRACATMSFHATTESNCGPFLQDKIKSLTIGDLAGHNRYARQDDQKNFEEKRRIMVDFLNHYNLMYEVRRSSWTKTYESNSEASFTQSPTMFVSTVGSIRKKYLGQDLSQAGMSEHHLAELVGKTAFFGNMKINNVLLKQNMTLWRDIVLGSRTPLKETQDLVPAIDQWGSVFSTFYQLFDNVRPDARDEFLLVYAALVLYGIEDCGIFGDDHSFARYRAYAILSHCSPPGFPTLYTNDPSQHLAFEMAMWKTKRNLSLVHRGEACDDVQDVLLKATSAAGLLYPLVELIVLHWVGISEETFFALKEKERATKDRSATQAIRQLREEASAGLCLICLGKKPNISTLCCSIAVHWNCLSTWLNSNATCPQCRGSMAARRDGERCETRSNEEGATGGHSYLRALHSLSSNGINDTRAESSSITPLREGALLSSVSSAIAGSLRANRRVSSNVSTFVAPPRQTRSSSNTASVGRQAVQSETNSNAISANRQNFTPLLPESDNSDDSGSESDNSRISTTPVVASRHTRLPPSTIAVTQAVLMSNPDSSRSVSSMLSEFPRPPSHHSQHSTGVEGSGSGAASDGTGNLRGNESYRAGTNVRRTRAIMQYEASLRSRANHDAHAPAVDNQSSEELDFNSGE